MPDVTIVYWRDIPAQVIVGKGRTGAKVKLTERFEQAIDRCAMKIGAKDADAYLAEWRKADPFAVDGEQMEVAEAEAAKNQWAVTIAIVDDGGHLLSLQRLDGAAPISSHIAPAKAKTSALGRRESKIYEDVINGGRYSFLSAPFIEGMLEGGVPILKDGVCIGAVGVTGVKSTEDAQIAKAGIAAIGL